MALVHSEREGARLDARESQSKAVIVPITVSRVVDGDTVIDSHGVRYRLQHIDAPEKRQQGGPEAMQHLQAIVKRVQTARGANAPHIGVRMQGNDKYNRVLGELFILSPGTAGQPESINALMVRDGWAWAYDRESPAEQSWRDLEDRARTAKRGLWGLPGTPMLPHTFRHPPEKERSKKRQSRAYNVLQQ